MEQKWSGIGASAGIGMGEALLYEAVDLSYTPRKLAEEEVAGEQAALRTALEQSMIQLQKIYEKAVLKLGESNAAVFQAHQMILEDPSFSGKMMARIAEDRIPAEEAVDRVGKETAAIFQAMDNEYMRERAQDLLDIARRLRANLRGRDIDLLHNIAEPVVLVAHELTPSDTALLNPALVRGIVTEVGGRTSHTAIMARSLEIPAVVGVTDCLARMRKGSRLVVDGETGCVVTEPSEDTWESYRVKKWQWEETMRELLRLKELPAETKDGHRVELAANIGSANDLKGALKYGAEGIGLFRTEFLYMDREEAPTEEEQFAVYREVAEAFGDKPVVIRTLDIGGDKELPYLNIPHEMNPFMGWRAIRFCLARQDLFKVQLRALLRAGLYGNIHIMYPFIAGLEDLRAANRVLAEVRAELEEAHIPHHRQPKVGIMMEIPSAAVMADQLAKEVDFFSIGTNDLIQYTLAADRMNQKVSGYYQPFHPAVLRLIKMIVDGGHKAGIWVGMCGEMAGDPKASEILLGLGLDELSMSASSILKVKAQVRELDYTTCLAAARQRTE